MSKFLPNQSNRRLFPGFVCFCIAGIGVALGFTASAFQIQPLYIAALAITVAGVAGGFFFVIYGWWATLTGRWSAQ